MTYLPQHVVDATVKELARRVNAEVQVLDAAILAAGRWGDYGDGMNFLQRL
jgi:hypothetical protein